METTSVEFKSVPKDFCKERIDNKSDEVQCQQMLIVFVTNVERSAEKNFSYKFWAPLEKDLKLGKFREISWWNGFSKKYVQLHSEKKIENVLSYFYDKNFEEATLLLIKLLLRLKKLISRNIFSERISTCKNFVKATFLLNWEVSMEMISRNIFELDNFSFSTFWQ